MDAMDDHTRSLTVALLDWERDPRTVTVAALVVTLLDSSTGEQ
jgi:hypothetical protein